MKKTLLSAIFTLLIAASCCAQTLTTIGGRCPSPNQGSFGQINFFGSPNGDLDYRPCTTGSSIFHGVVNFSDATIILPGFVTGSGTTNFIPRWTNGAGSVIGNTPFSWNNTLYKFQNTGLNNSFVMEFTPSSTVGLFNVGSGGNLLSVDQVSGISALSGTMMASITGDTASIGVSANQIDIDSGSGATTIGDIQGIGTNTTATIDDAGSRIALFAAGGVRLPAQSPSAILTLNSSNTITSNLLANGQIPIGSIGADPVMAAITAGTGINITNGAGSITIATGAQSATSLTRTITSAGTTGNQVINTIAGTVNFAAAATDITVTNSTASATSLIFCTVQSLDTTAISCRVTDKTSGSFHIRIPAATAETSVAFWVTN